MSKSPWWNIGTIRRVGWAAFTKTYSRGKWLISHLTPTFAIIIHIPSVPVYDVPTSLYLTPRIRIPQVAASHNWCPQVIRLASPSPHTCVPMFPSQFYTQLIFWVRVFRNILIPCKWTLILIFVSRLVGTKGSRAHPSQHWCVSQHWVSHGLGHLLFGPYLLFLVFTRQC